MAYIIKPLVSEKMNALTEKENKFGFIVRPEANKYQIKQEVDSHSHFPVVGVSTMVYAGKSKSRYTRSGLLRGRSNAFKKAIVSLKEGEYIDLYSKI